MSRPVFDSVARAYCPKFDEERQIKIGLIEILDNNGSKQYHWTYFNCRDQFTCEHFDRRFGCPFINDITERLK